MNHKNANLQKLDLKLNLSPPGIKPRAQPQTLSPKVSPTSTPSSCVSSEPKQEEILCFSSGPDAIQMTLVGCHNCLMYIFVPNKNLRCPKCQSTDLIKEFEGNSSTSVSTNITDAITNKKHKGN